MSCVVFVVYVRGSCTRVLVYQWACSGSQPGYSSVGRASDCRSLQLSDGPWFDSGWPDMCSGRFGNIVFHSSHDGFPSSLLASNMFPRARLTRTGARPGGGGPWNRGFVFLSRRALTNSVGPRLSSVAIMAARCLLSSVGRACAS